MITFARHWRWLVLTGAGLAMSVIPVSNALAAPQHTYACTAPTAFVDVYPSTSSLTSTTGTYNLGALDVTCVAKDASGVTTSTWYPGWDTLAGSGTYSTTADCLGPTILSGGASLSLTDGTTVGYDSAMSFPATEVPGSVVISNAGDGTASGGEGSGTGQLQSGFVSVGGSNCAGNGTWLMHELSFTIVI